MEPVKILIEQLEQILRASIEMIPQIAVAVVVLVAVWGINHLVYFIFGRALTHTKLRQSLKDLFSLLITLRSAKAISAAQTGRLGHAPHHCDLRCRL
ncbi:hypothetical protein [Ascidiaceihabitans sp.]|uniref:hypothetical protein n=1 Tax=Ascidiaceihabitans sp. TaxID=1872644 RepID=UPI003296C42D